MPQTVTCSRCQRELHITRDSTSAWLTCPHCLARVVNPRALIRTDRPAPPTRPEPSIEDTTCPGCGRAVERGWRRCPYCEELLRRGSFRREEDSLDKEVHRDSRGGVVAAVVLGVLLLIGAIVFVGSGGPKLVSSSREGPAVFGIGVLVLGAILVGTVAVVVTSKSRALTAVTGILGGLLVGGGIVVLLIFLFCLGIMQTCQFGK